MRVLTHLRAGLLALTAVALLSGCDSAKRNDPAPAAPVEMHRVEVRYATANAADLGALVEVRDQRAYGEVVLRATETPGPTATGSLPLGPYDAGGSVEVGLTFTNVTRGGPLRVPPGSSLSAEIWVDGVLRKTVSLTDSTGHFTNTAASRTNPAYETEAAVEFD